MLLWPLLKTLHSILKSSAPTFLPLEELGRHNFTIVHHVMQGMALDPVFHYHWWSPRLVRNVRYHWQVTSVPIPQLMQFSDSKTWIHLYSHTEIFKVIYRGVTKLVTLATMSLMVIWSTHSGYGLLYEVWGHEAIINLRLQLPSLVIITTLQALHVEHTPAVFGPPLKLVEFLLVPPVCKHSWLAGSMHWSACLHPPLSVPHGVHTAWTEFPGQALELQSQKDQNEVLL